MRKFGKRRRIQNFAAGVLFCMCRGIQRRAVCPHQGRIGGSCYIPAQLPLKSTQDQIV